MKKKITPTSKQLEIMKEYWSHLNRLTNKYRFEIEQLEFKMEKVTGIKGIEFIWDDMGQGIIGIGNFERTMDLLQIEELEKNEE
jgi:hypothetical protein